MKLLIVLIFLLPFFAFGSCPTILKSEVRLLHSEQTIDLCQEFAGHTTLIVNTASHCGYTHQFKDLEALHQSYQSRGLKVIGFPSNDFNQAARDEAQAARVCYENYGVSFTMLAPSKVTGSEANEVFKEIQKQSMEPQWNFTKYLVDVNGKVVQRFDSSVSPQSKVVIDAIEAQLNRQ